MTNDDEWTYQEEDFNEDLPFVELQFGIEDLYLLYKSVAGILFKKPFFIKVKLHVNPMI